MLEGPQSCFVLSGAGTSGRLAFLTARNFNRCLKAMGRPEIFQYLIAGGDASLIKAQENAEDNPRLGTDDLMKVTQGKHHVVFIGITCGLSAPYVAGQLDYAMNQSNFEVICIGFNALSQSRNIFVESWDKNFRQVLQRMETHSRSYIVNPIIGPEAITGSTRLKGGSATKIILDTIFSKVIAEISHSNAFVHMASPFHLVSPPMSPSTSVPSSPSLNNAVNAATNTSNNTANPASGISSAISVTSQIATSTVAQILRMYENVYRETYMHLNNIANLINLAAQTLKQGGNIFYMSDYDPFALFGLLDASECPPTFGSAFTDVQGVVKDGWQHMGNHENMMQFISTSDIYDISWSKLSSITKNDLLVVLHLGIGGLNDHPTSQMSQTLTKIHEKGNLNCDDSSC